MARRMWSLAALASAAAALVLAAVVAVGRFPKGLTVLACLVLSIYAAWYGIQRRGIQRWAGLAAAALLLAGAVVLVVVEHRLVEDLLVIAAVAAALAATQRAFRVHIRLPRAERPVRPVLFYNPLSGGGKAERFHLVKEARRRGIEPIELRRGDDLERLVRDAVGNGADALAMAGGDGSQAVVAMIAAELDLPYACIPAGTRNHFALDLGVDRDDVVGALDAFVDGGERRVDLGVVNGRVFVNNVSLGLYADAVQHPGYREAKLHTLLNTVPVVLGPDAAAPHLRWQGPGGDESAAAILVSNNPYRLARVLGTGTRPRLSRGLLGVAVMAPMSMAARPSRRHRLRLQQWTAERFVVESDETVAAGIDGESVELHPPLRFDVRPKALRVRIAPQHPGASPSALEPEKPWQTFEVVARFVVDGGSRDLTRMG
jgi:diacylglycerol kinase family enzyme